MRIKVLLIIVAFLLCLMLLVMTRQATSGVFSIHHIDFYEKGGDWDGFRFDKIALNQDSTELLCVNEKGTAKFESPSVKTDFEFNEILLSWNCFCDSCGGLYIAVSVSPDGKYWNNFSYQTWGFQPVDFDSIKMFLPSDNIEDVGWLDVDIIRLYVPMRFYKFTFVCFKDKSCQFFIDRISVCYSNTSADIRQYNNHYSVVNRIKKVSLAVPFRSQHSLPDNISGLTCSPTSLAMVLNYHGRGYSPLEVSELVYDPNNEIYGNWLYNIQAAYAIGMEKTWVGRHNSFNELVPELLDGKPVVISIAFDYGKLAGSPISETDGHLIVVRGFDRSNRVLVNDPAGYNVSDGICAYDLSELTQAWIGHGGIAYHIWPE
ncbi:MAG: hypothetical protein B6D58_03860 [candidate division Zixibacteria bacterium 4484_95]|nr:MAG: hypothetical protein B6D58_03860 [candidate division Zixibacteria bacterium 4484_95]RKX19320.1 MAG: hypothetical protein DRP26_03635 [candidate division Zixibacteria bacterium]